MQKEVGMYVGNHSKKEAIGFLNLKLYDTVEDTSLK